MRRILILFVFVLNLLPMITNCNWNTAKAQTIDNEYGYDCEEDDGYTYVSPIPCDAVEICREQCPLCGDFMDCEDSWTHYCYTPDENGNNGNGDYGDGNGSYGLGGSGSSGSSTGYSGTTYVILQKQAIDLINNYKKRSKNERFFTSDIYKDSYLETLKNIILHPQTINQGSNGTCGAAVLMKMLAEISPSDLVNAAVSLFDNGTYKQWGWTISDDMKKCSKQQLNEIGINEVEAMIQTGIINGNNKYLQYSANTDNQGNEDFLNKKYDGLKSFMWHTYIRDFMSSIYPEKFIERTTSPSYETIKLIDYAKEFVVAAVDCNGSNFVNSLIPTHYVQITSVGRKDSKDNFVIEYWNYGTIDKSYNNSRTYINYLYRIRR